MFMAGRAVATRGARGLRRVASGVVTNADADAIMQQSTSMDIVMQTLPLQLLQGFSGRDLGPARLSLRRSVAHIAQTGRVGAGQKVADEAREARLHFLW